MKTNIKRTLKRCIGGFRYAGKRVSPQETLGLLLKRIESLEEEQFQMIRALNVLGAGQCYTSNDWFLEHELIRAGDRSQAIKHFDPDYFFSEWDDEKQGTSNLCEVFQQINKRGLHKLLKCFPHEDGKMIEPYFSIYKATQPK